MHYAILHPLLLPVSSVLGLDYFGGSPASWTLQARRSTVGFNPTESFATQYINELSCELPRVL